MWQFGRRGARRPLLEMKCEASGLWYDTLRSPQRPKDGARFFVVG